MPIPPVRAAVCVLVGGAVLFSDPTVSEGSPRPPSPSAGQSRPFLRGADEAAAPRVPLGVELRRPSPQQAKPAPPPTQQQQQARAAPSATRSDDRPRTAQRPAATETRTYTVADGDTLWVLARRFGTTVEAISSTNGISEDQFLRPGQRLRIPTGGRAGAGGGATAAASTYTVRSGDTLWAIALKTGVDVDTLARANRIQGDALRVGQRLVIPRPGTAVGGPHPGVATERRVGTRRAQMSVHWPARGVLTSRFGMRWRRHHNGIDIAAPHGTPIFAARDGRVIRTGWVGGFGRLVVLDHGDGMETWYAHASRILVRVGQRVQRGQQIAAVGCTGFCTGPHVHFEVRIHGRPVDPLRHLR